MECKCGHNRFYAHQLCRVDVIVDEDGNWESNTGKDNTIVVYDAENPYGPFTCTKCGEEYEEIK